MGEAREGMHYDSTANPRDIAIAKNEAMKQAVEDQISRADMEELTQILDNATDAFLKNPEVFKDPESASKLASAARRFRELTGKKDSTH